jgi:hypothetical protein
MIALRVAPKYDKDRTQYQEQIAFYQKKINKAVDLFSRIKSTEQAEEVMTVFFAARQLKATRNGDATERDLQNYILEWKKSWRTDAKREAIAGAIRNLILLGWVRLQISEAVQEVA